MRKREAQKHVEPFRMNSGHNDNDPPSTLLQLMQARKIYNYHSASGNKARFTADHDPTLGPRIQPYDAKINMNKLILAGQKILQGREIECANTVDSNVEYKNRDCKVPKNKIKSQYDMDVNICDTIQQSG